MKSITVIIPVYNEVESLKELHKELTAVLSGNDNYELLFVDDGSSDGSINYRMIPPKYLISLQNWKRAMTLYRAGKKHVMILGQNVGLRSLPILSLD